MRKLKIFISTVFCLMLTMMVMPNKALALGESELKSHNFEGTVTNGYEIKTVQDLKDFSDMVNCGNASINAFLANDIDFTLITGYETGKDNFTAIGNATTNFTGLFDGCSYVIRGLTINKPKEEYQGLFGYIGENCKVMNVGLEDGSISGKDYSGGIAGCGNCSTILNCYNKSKVNAYMTKAEVKSAEYVSSGGILGYGFSCIVKYCYNTGEVSNLSVVPSNCGGLLGLCLYGTIMQCYNTGSVSSSTSQSNLGGIAGRLIGSGVTNCYNIGSVSCSCTSGSSNIGGIVGDNRSRDLNNNYYLSEYPLDGSSVELSGIGFATEGNISVDEIGKIMGKGKSEFNNGLVAWHLNASWNGSTFIPITNELWLMYQQDLSTAGTTPVLTSETSHKVYQISFTGDYSEKVYTNNIVNLPILNSGDYSFTLDGEQINLETSFNDNKTVTAMKKRTVTVNGGDYNLRHSGGTVKNKESITLPFGSQVTLETTDDATFLYWENENGKVMSRNSSYTFTLTNDIRITMRRKADAVNTAYVEFVSSYNQVISSGTYNADGSSCTDGEALSLPTDIPLKVGYIFDAWSMNVEDIKTYIGNGYSHIVVTPKYLEKSDKFSITQYNAKDGAKLSDNPISSNTYTDLASGTSKTLTAETISGMKFKCWSSDINGTTVLGTNENYFLQLSSNVEIFAIYVEEDKTVTQLPTIVITNRFKTSTGEVKKISFVATRAVPEGNTLLEHGMLYARGITEPSKDSFIIGGTDVKRFAATGTGANGVFTLNIKTSNDTEMIYSRAYMIVKNNTGGIEIIYSDLNSGKFKD